MKIRTLPACASKNCGRSPRNLDVSTIMALDIGGTAVKAGIFENGTLSDVREFPTNASLGGKYVVNRAKEIIYEYKSTTRFDAIGISTAGQVDPKKGRIIYANNNIPGYTGTQLKNIMEAEFLVPVAVENDVNAAAIGEAVFGAGQGLSDFVCLTYGTGVGGAMFVGGELYHGSSCSAGEFGAMVIHPEDRNPDDDMYSGCYEKYASVTALVNAAKKLDNSLDSGRAVFARKDESAVREIIDKWIMEIVYGLVSVVHMLNPSCIILGGGVMEQTYVLEKVKENLYDNIMPSFRHVEIKKAGLGNSAGLIGAACLHIERI